MKIVTGRTGKPHVTSEDDRLLQQAIWKEDGIFAFEPSKMVDANTFRVMPINILFQGCHARILPGEYEDLRIDSGEAGKKRYDLIVVRYEIDTDGIESIRLVVIKGTAVPTSGTAVMPSYITGDINKGATIADMLLWVIPINGINVGAPVLQCAKLQSIKDKITKGDSYTKTESNKITEDIYDTIQSNRISTEKSIDSLSECINANSNKISVVGETASTAKSAADVAKDMAEENSNSIRTLNSDLAQTNVNVNTNAKSIKDAQKTAEAGKVVTGSTRLNYSFEAGTAGNNKRSFDVPAGTDGVFVVLKSASNITYLGYDYTISGGVCTVTVQYDIKSGTGALTVLAVCVGPAAAVVKGASS